MKYLGPGPLGPWIMDPIYVICAFGSTLSYIFCERKSQIEAPFDSEISSEQHNLWPGADFLLLHVS